MTWVKSDKVGEYYQHLWDIYEESGIGTIGALAAIIKPYLRNMSQATTDEGCHEIYAAIHVQLETEEGDLGKYRTDYWLSVYIAHLCHNTKYQSGAGKHFAQMLINKMARIVLENKNVTLTEFVRRNLEKPISEWEKETSIQVAKAVQESMKDCYENYGEFG